MKIKVYTDGVLYNEDCFKVVEHLIKNNIKVDHIICDPPYNIHYDEWDKGFDLLSLVPKFKQIIKPNGNIIFFQGWSNVCETKQEMDKYFTIQDWIIYDRIKGRGGKKHLVSTREDILWYTNDNEYVFNKIPSTIKKKTGGLGLKNGCEFRAMSNVWTDISPLVPWSKERNGHPTQKPLQLMERCITIWSNEGDTILDFTMGSGSTIEACRNLNRKFIGIEKDKKWFDVVVNRLENKDIIQQ